MRARARKRKSKEKRNGVLVQIQILILILMETFWLGVRLFLNSTSLTGLEVPVPLPYSGRSTSTLFTK